MDNIPTRALDNIPTFRFYPPLLFLRIIWRNLETSIPYTFIMLVEFEKLAHTASKVAKQLTWPFGQCYTFKAIWATEMSPLIVSLQSEHHSCASETVLRYYLNKLLCKHQLFKYYLSTVQSDFSHFFPLITDWLITFIADSSSCTWFSWSLITGDSTL